MWISKWFVLFIIFSFLGWIYETVYCTIKSKKWENRGFLYGPICPIYGAGATALVAVMNLIASFLSYYTWWMVFLVGFLGSIVLEYSTHYILEKIFHACWWDYSYRKFNIKGRVCLTYSIAFGFAALIVVYGIDPWVEHLIVPVAPLALEAMGLIFMLILGMDLSLTIVALTNFENNVAAVEESLNQKMDQFVDGITEKSLTEILTQNRIVNGIRHMGGLSRNAISRVYRFRPYKKRDVSMRNRILESIKNFKNGRSTDQSGAET